MMFIDGKKDMNNGLLQRALTRELNMYDVISEVGGVPPITTHKRGTKQIDGVWATNDLRIVRACFLPFDLGLGDHRGVLIDIQEASVLNKVDSMVIRPKMCRLQSWNKPVKQKYIQALISHSADHKLLWKVRDYGNEDGKTWSILSDCVSGSYLDKIDKNITRGMIHAEKRCRRLRTGKVHYLSELSTAGRILSLSRKVLWYWTKGGVKRRIIRQHAARCGILFPLALNMNQVNKEVTKAEEKYTVMKAAS